MITGEFFTVFRKKKSDKAAISPSPLDLLEKGRFLRVAAVIGAHLRESPGATAEDVRQMLRESARDLGAPGYDIAYGWGYIDAGE